MRVKKRLSNFLLTISSLVVLFLLLEGMFQIFYIPPVKVTTNVKGLQTSKSHQMDDQLGWLPKKNIEGIHAKPPIFESTFQTNSLGIRDKEYSFEKPLGVTRLVAIGDSFTWGYGVNDHEVYTEVLESLLPKTEVINLGVTGYGVPQEFWYLKRLGVQFKPDIVLLAFFLNDIGNPYWKEKVRTGRDKKGNKIPTDFQERKKPIAPPPQTNLFLDVKNFLMNHSALYAFVLDRVNRFMPLVRLLVRLGIKEKLDGLESLDWELRPTLKVYPDELEAKFNATKENILEVQQWLKEKKIRLVVALIPSVEAVDVGRFNRAIAYNVYEADDFDLTKPYRILEEFGKEHELEIVNPLEIFKVVHAKEKKLYFEGDPHFNKDGHELFAQQIGAYLKKSQNF